MAMRAMPVGSSAAPNATTTTTTTTTTAPRAWLLRRAAVVVLLVASAVAAAAVLRAGAKPTNLVHADAVSARGSSTSPSPSPPTSSEADDGDGGVPAALRTPSSSADNNDDDDDDEESPYTDETTDETTDDADGNNLTESALTKEALAESQEEPTTVGEEDPRVARADSGAGYDPRPNRNKTTVVLWGSYWNFKDSVLELTGCPNTRRKGECPYHPECRIFYSDKPEELHKADVVVIPIKVKAPPENDWLFMRPKDKPFRIVYRREAFWAIPYPKSLLRARYSLDMSFRPNAGIPNPTFLVAPKRMFFSTAAWGVEDAPRARPQFALSLISDCTTLSHRELYVTRLAAFLGSDKYHRYGKCGDGYHVLDKQDFSSVGKYKFIFEFENTIQPDYTSEKLFFALSLGPVPVYMGAKDLPRITKTKSFINVRDFATPEQLGKYLLWLAKNPDEYNKFHTWRRSPAGSGLADEYLDLVAKQVPGKAELETHADVSGGVWTNRRASCCRMCNLAYLRERMAESEPGGLSGWVTWDDLDKTFFNGTMSKRVG